MRNQRSLTTRMYGPAPAADAPASQTLRYARRMALRLASTFVLLLILGIVAHFPLWLMIAVGVAVAIMLAHQFVLTVRIRRLERSERSP
jgi:Flp pilus assembly protein TadB